MSRDSSPAWPARRDRPPGDQQPGGQQPGGQQPGRQGEDAGVRDVRELILDATERLLATRRFESLSVADILNAADVARGSFYFYFANKHAVLAELVRRAVGGAHEAAGVWTDDSSGVPGAALSRGTAEGTRLWREHAAVLRRRLGDAGLSRARELYVEDKVVRRQLEHLNLLTEAARSDIRTVSVRATI